jgi:hypothetical protein
MITQILLMKILTGYHCVRVTDGIPPESIEKRMQKEAERAAWLVKIDPRINKNL